MSKLTKKHKRQGFLTLLADILFWTLGAFLFSFSVQYFITPNQLAAGGVTGIATTISDLFPILPAGMLVILINIPLFIAAWVVFGWRFIIKTVTATAMASLFLDMMPYLLPHLPSFEGEKLLCAIFGGLLCGIGLGLVFMRGATTGGMDIAAWLLRRRVAHISTGMLINLLDLAVVVFAGLCYRSIESLLYSIIVIFISGRAMDYIISGMGHGRMLMIVTAYPDEVTRDITRETERGVSILPAQGGYTGEEKKMLLCVVRSHEVSAIRKIVKRYDPNPFIIITESSEVLGLGFKDHNEIL